MRQISVIHCADIHYDSEIKFLMTKEKKRCEERRQSFEHLLKICKDEKIRYLLIAGDLFDRPEPEEKYVLRLQKAFAACEDTHIFIAAGNHDFVSDFSPYRRRNFWTENVHIFREDWECIQVEEGVSVYGAGFRQMYQKKPLLGRCRQDGDIHLGVLHGEVCSASLYNPVPQEKIAESGLNYLALGHIHKRTDILCSGHTYYSNPGCHDGRGFDEAGILGAYIGKVWRGGCEMEFLPLSSRRLFSVRMDISGMGQEELLQTLLERLPGRKEDLYELHLTGRGQREFFDWKWLEGRLGIFYIKWIEEYAQSLDISDRSGVRGEFVKSMERKIEQAEDEERELCELALQIGLAAFSGEVSYHED